MPRFFKRFRDIREGDHWYVGKDRWDAMCFIPNQAIRVIGMGIYELHPTGGSFLLGWKYILENEGGIEIETSPIYEEFVEDYECHQHVIKHRFTSIKGINVAAG